MASKRGNSQEPSLEDSIQESSIAALHISGRPPRRAASKGINYSEDVSYKKSAPISTFTKKTKSRGKREHSSDIEDPKVTTPLTRSLRPRRVTKKAQPESNNSQQESDSNESNGEISNNDENSKTPSMTRKEIRVTRSKKIPMSSKEEESDDFIKTSIKNAGKRVSKKQMPKNKHSDPNQEDSEKSDDPLAIKKVHPKSSKPDQQISGQKSRSLRNSATQKKVSYKESEVEDESSSLSSSSSDFQSEPSTRNRPKRAVSKKNVSYMEDDDFMVISDDESEDGNNQDDDDDDSKKKSVPKRERKRKIIQSSSSDSSFDSTNFIAAHHNFCLRCHQRGFHQNGQQRKSTDESKLLILCDSCAFSVHWECMPSSAKSSKIHKTFKCHNCIKNKSVCLICSLDAENRTKSVTIEDKSLDRAAEKNDKGNDDGLSNSSTPSDSANELLGSNVFFRCYRCFLTIHDTCLPPLDNEENSEISDIVHLQEKRIRAYRKQWKCHECLGWDFEVEKILTYQDVILDNQNDISKGSSTSVSTPKRISSSSAPLVKNLEKDPSSTNSNTSRRFLIKFKERSYRRVSWVNERWLTNVAPIMLRYFWKKNLPSLNEGDVIPRDWTKVDRVLDVVFENDETMAFAEFTNEKDELTSIKQVKRALIKWQGMTYDEATWEEDMDPSDPDFNMAYKYRLESLKISAPKSENVRKGRFKEHEEQPSYIPGKLMDYQKDGVNWLLYQWYHDKSCLLADDMGLGKTIQVISYLSILFHENKYHPYLIVVPKSTAINWVREFRKWAPDMKVVEYHGETANRDVIEKYELYPFPEIKDRDEKPLRCHVVITTYETMTASPAIFQRVPIWQVLIVDEAHRLKGGTNSQLFQTLKSRLEVRQSILLTGTPLQNNIEELFNLMNFLGLEDFHDPRLMAQEYEEFSKEKLDELHEKLKPYFLRRTKEQVLGFLPPKAEIIVPVAMTSLQKKLCKEILAKNVELLKTITSKATVAKQRKMSLQNVLMEVRKVLCHPYLMPGIEDTTIEDDAIIHKNLVEASGKLILLQKMLPKLKAKGNRVLIFSQFKMLLDIFEDFVIKEGWKYVRLDGDISGDERQDRIDSFQADDSNIFIFLLTTRAGGVGLNLTGADTVFIYDPDFNPHADMQALSRVHRIGQEKKVLVFRFVTRSSAEERILQIGKRKLVLDHLIVEKMEEENLGANDVESVLRFGAEALFSDESDDTMLKYSDEDIEKLLDRSQMENTPENGSTDLKDLHGLAFARIWDADKKGLTEESPEDNPANDTGDFWEKLIQQRIDQAAALGEVPTIGRKTRKRTKVVNYFEDEADSPKKRRTRKEKEIEQKLQVDQDDEFVLKEEDSGSTTSGTTTDLEREDIKHLTVSGALATSDRSLTISAKNSDSLNNATLQSQSQHSINIYPIPPQPQPQTIVSSVQQSAGMGGLQQSINNSQPPRGHGSYASEVSYAQWMQYQQDAWRRRQREEHEHQMAYQAYLHNLQIRQTQAIAQRHLEAQRYNQQSLYQAQVPSSIPDTSMNSTNSAQVPLNNPPTNSNYSHGQNTKENSVKHGVSQVKNDIRQAINSPTIGEVMKQKTNKHDIGSSITTPPSQKFLSRSIPPSDAEVIILDSPPHESTLSFTGSRQDITPTQQPTPLSNASSRSNKSQNSSKLSTRTTPRTPKSNNSRAIPAARSNSNQQLDVITPLRRSININSASNVNTDQGMGWAFPSPGSLRNSTPGGNHHREISDLLSYIDAIQHSKEPIIRKKKALEAIFHKLQNMNFDATEYFRSKAENREIDAEIVPTQVNRVR
ncbi:hypothetical protein G9A89_017788 [Geosiphon pyriformis]|nr:hypothetical protein G9A89_017788 [Geosiphon pyriformis]